MLEQHCSPMNKELLIKDSHFFSSGASQEKGCCLGTVNKAHKDHHTIKIFEWPGTFFNI